MNSYAWVGMLGIIIFTLLPLLSKKNRSHKEVKKAVVTVVIVLGIIIAVLIFNVSYLSAVLFGFLAMILFSPNTYTKKRLIIYGSILLVVGVAGYAIFRDNPDYVLNHLKENPQTSSLYVAENGLEFITYQSDVVRPLASTVKILIAVEYAMQIDANTLQKDSVVTLEELNRYYIKNTDGNAHEEWLKTMESEGKIKDNAVTLHEVAKGMVTYSSNANTDYLIDLLGIDAINAQAKSLGLTQHEEVYPIVSALLIPKHVKQDSMSEEQLINALERMPMEEYRSQAVALSQQMKDGTINANEITFDSSPDIQKVWSDRLIGASANDYGKLLAVISNDQLPTVAAETARDLLEWPMQLNEDNHKRFVHLGSKGGSTMFILNNAIYAENHAGDKFELVFQFDELNFLESLLIGNNRRSFESKLLRNEDYRMKVQEELSY